MAGEDLFKIPFQNYSNENTYDGRKNINIKEIKAMNQKVGTKALLTTKDIF